MENKRKQPDGQTGERDRQTGERDRQTGERDRQTDPLQEIPIGEMPSVFSSPKPRTKKPKVTTSPITFGSSLDLSDDKEEKEQSSEKPAPVPFKTTTSTSTNKLAPIKVVTYTEKNNVIAANGPPMNMRGTMIPPGGVFTNAPNDNVTFGAPSTISTMQITDPFTYIPANQRIIDLTSRPINLAKVEENIKLSKELVTLIKKVSNEQTRAIAIKIIDYMLSALIIGTCSAQCVISISRRKYVEMPTNDEQHISISPISLRSINVDLPPGVSPADMGFAVRYVFENAPRYDCARCFRIMTYPGMREDEVLIELKLVV
jgi:hypothetical protein